MVHVISLAIKRNCKGSGEKKTGAIWAIAPDKSSSLPKGTGTDVSRLALSAAYLAAGSRSAISQECLISTIKYSSMPSIDLPHPSAGWAIGLVSLLGMISGKIPERIVIIIAGLIGVFFLS